MSIEDRMRTLELRLEQSEKRTEELEARLMKVREEAPTLQGILHCVEGLRQDTRQTAIRLAEIEDRLPSLYDSAMAVQGQRRRELQREIDTMGKQVHEIQRVTKAVQHNMLRFTEQFLHLARDLGALGQQISKY